MNKQALKLLDYFTGTEAYHRVSPRLVITDGVKHLCENAGCYWLVDIINSYQHVCQRDGMLRDMQFWHLRPGSAPRENTNEGKMLAFNPWSDSDNAACHVVCERDTNNVAIVQELPLTDFPFDALPEVKLYCQNNGSNSVVCLPSEY